MSHDPPRLRARLALRVASLLSLAFAAVSAPALAGPADGDDPLIDPRREGDPRLDLEHPTPARAPLWFAVDTSFVRRSGGDTSFGAMLLVGIPLDRLAARPPRYADPPALKPPPRGKVEPPAPPPAPPIPPPPLRIPIVVTPDAARAAVDAALRLARLVDPDARVDAMAARARASAALPELRLRVLRSVDQGQTLSPTEYDPARTTATGGTSFWMEARATWRLDRLVFAEEEAALERLRGDRAAARAKLSARVLKLLFEWQKALAHADNTTASPEENLAARLRAIEAEAELDLITGGWLSRWKKAQDAPR